MKAKKRTKVLQVRLYPSELQQVKRAAAGVPLSEFARFRLLGAALTVPATTIAALASDPLPAVKNTVIQAGRCKLCGAEYGHKLACPSRQQVGPVSLTQSFEPDA